MNDDNIFDKNDEIEYVRYKDKTQDKIVMSIYDNEINDDVDCNVNFDNENEKDDDDSNDKTKTRL